MPAKLNIEQERKVIETYLAGHSIQKTSDICLVTLTTVRAVLGRNSIELRNPSGSKTRIYDQKDKDSVVERYLSGLSTVELSKEYGTSSRSISRVLEKAGIQLRKTWAKKTRKCWSCKDKKSIEEFTKSSATKNGYSWTCLECNSSFQRQHKLTYNGKKTVSSHIRQLMFEQQKGLCAICLVVSEKLVVDHDHKTGLVRKLLCNRCNTGLGQFKDNPQNLLNAIAYLKEHQ